MRHRVAVLLSAAIVAGVLSGASSRADLEQAGAPLILDTIADILPHVTGLPTGGRRGACRHGVPCAQIPSQTTVPGAGTKLPDLG